MSRSLVIKLATGTADPERVLTGLNVGAAAVAAGVTVSLWLSGDATWLATTDQRPDLALTGAPDWRDLYEIISAKNPVKVCAQCAERRGITAADLQPRAGIAGAASFVAEVTDPGVQALIY
jgi:predicted peroxiredoxin